MSACHKFKLGDYVNVSADFMASFRFSSGLRGQFHAAQVVGFASRYEIWLQFDGKPGDFVFHMDDWEKP